MVNGLVVSKTLWCGACERDLPIEKFSKKPRAKRGYSYKCKDCHNLYCKTRWYPNNQKRQIKASRKWKAENKNKVLASRYNTDEKTIIDLFESAQGKCNICGSQDSIVVDHCHVTGEIRGILCSNHNIALGLFRDNPLHLKNAIDYLIKR